MDHGIVTYAEAEPNIAAIWQAIVDASSRIERHRPAVRWT